MAEFVILPVSDRVAGTQYTSGNYNISANTTRRKFQFKISGIDLINEPSTTVIHWRIEMRKNPSQDWHINSAGSFPGRDGEPAPFGRPYGVRSLGLSPGLKGQQIRGIVFHEAAGNDNKVYGVNGEEVN